jgi:hypothetical protein
MSQNRQLRFGDFDIKITTMVSYIGSQNQAGYGLLVCRLCHKIDGRMKTA